MTATPPLWGRLCAIGALRAVMEAMGTFATRKTIGQAQIQGVMPAYLTKGGFAAQIHTC